MRDRFWAWEFQNLKPSAVGVPKNSLMPMSTTPFSGLRPIRTIRAWSAVRAAGTRDNTRKKKFVVVVNKA